MPVVMLLCRLQELWLCPLPHDRRHSSRSESRFFFKLLYGRSILSLFCAISDPSGGACGGSEFSDSEGFMKQPALGPVVAVEEPALAAEDGGLMRYLTVPNALDALLLVPLPFPPGVCCDCVCVCVAVEATVDIPLPVPGFETWGLGGAVASSPVGGFMANTQSISCGGVPLEKIRSGIACGRLGLVVEYPCRSMEVSWSSFLAEEEVVESLALSELLAVRGNRHFATVFR